MTRFLISRTFAAAILLASAAARAAAQASTQAPPATWTLTLELGAFVQGNRAAIANWLRHNSYGATQQQCGFNLLVEPVCDPPVTYPQVSESGVLARLATVERRMSARTALAVAAATEQSGVIRGRCNDQASPKDSRCTDQFIELEFGGASFAMLGVLSADHVRLGAGPAVLLANWHMRPAHLAGMWLDATTDHEPWPLFLRAQYRVYRLAGLAPQQHFSGFHPSTLFLGLGVKFSLNN